MAGKKKCEDVRVTFRWASLWTTAALGCALFAGCSSDDSNDGGSNKIGGTSTGASAGTSPMPTATGGTSGTGGTSAAGGTGATGTAGSGGTGGTGTGVRQGESCEGLPIEIPEPTAVDAGSTATPDGGSADASVDPNGTGGSDAEAPCVGVALEAEAAPVDMYIMMDKSTSMNEPLPGATRTRWEGVAEAIQQFVASPEAAGVGVGIQFFPGAGGLVDDLRDCNTDLYSNPEVPIGQLPDVGSDIVSAIDATRPGGLTPTLPALEGAVEYAKTWAQDNPDRVTVVLFVTDGFPTKCQNPVSIREIADVAQDARDTDPRVLTFVIGLAGDLNLDSIAAAGGTGSAFIIESGDVTEPFLQTVLSIARTPLSCEYEIPEAPSSVEQIDFDKVQLLYTPVGMGTEEIPKLDSPAQCVDAPNGGFYYDNTATPNSIRVCDCSCNRFGAGRINVRLGCEPRRGSIQ